MSPLPVRAALFAVAALSFLSPAAHATTFGEPVTVAPAADGTNASTWPAVDVDGDGDVTAVWASDGESGYGLYSATRAPSPTAPWSEATWVAPLVSAPRELRLRVNDAGQAVLGWADTLNLDSGDQQLVVATRTAAGQWTATPIAGSIDSTVLQDVAIDAGGRAVGLWNLVDPLRLGMGAIQQPLGGQPVPTNGPAGAQASELSVGIDAAGNASVVYTDVVDGDVHTATRPAGGQWQAPQLLDTPGGTGDAYLSWPRLSVAPDGRAVAAWYRDGEGVEPAVRQATRTASGTWTTPATLTAIASGVQISGVETSIDAAGRGTVAWLIGGGTQGQTTAKLWAEVRAATATAGAPFPAGAVVHRLDVEGAFEALPPMPSWFHLVGGRDGSTVATWSLGYSGAVTLRAAVRKPSAGWEPATTLAQAQTDGDDVTDPLALAIDAAGRGTAVWVDGRTTKSRTLALGSTPGPVDPGPKDPGTGDPGTGTPQPSNPGTGNPQPSGNQPPAGNPQPTPPAKTAAPSKLVIAVYLVPSKRKCPTIAAATVAGVRTNLKVSKAKVRKKLVCKVTGTVVLKTPTKVGTKVDILVTAKGVKRKAIQVAATA